MLTRINNIIIDHDENWSIREVTLDGKNITDIICCQNSSFGRTITNSYSGISSGQIGITWDGSNVLSRQLPRIQIQDFNIRRPDNAKVILPDEFESIFHSIFPAVYELYRTNRACLAAYLSSFLFEKLSTHWLNYMKNGQHILAIPFWTKILSIVHKWEKDTGKHIHKGTPYAFIAYAYLVIGDIDTGFTYIYNAIEDDIELNKVCPGLNYPYDAPVHRTATLSSHPENVFIDLVKEIRLELEKYLNLYQKEFGRTLTMEEFDRRFLQNRSSNIEPIKYYFVFNFWAIFEYRRKVGHDLMKNDFAKLKNSNWLFALCLVIDKLLNNLRPDLNYISEEIIQYAKVKKWIPQHDLEKLISKNNLNISHGCPDQVLLDLLPMTLRIKKEIQCLLVAWNLRNFAGHNIRIQNVMANNFEDLLKTLLFDIFLIIEEDYGSDLEFG